MARNLRAEDYDTIVQYICARTDGTLSNIFPMDMKDHSTSPVLTNQGSSVSLYFLFSKKH